MLAQHIAVSVVKLADLWHASQQGRSNTRASVMTPMTASKAFDYTTQFHMALQVQSAMP